MAGAARSEVFMYPYACQGVEIGLKMGFAGRSRCHSHRGDHQGLSHGERPHARRHRHLHSLLLYSLDPEKLVDLSAPEK